MAYCGYRYVPLHPTWKLLFDLGPGEPKLAQGPMCLAVQGIGPEEAKVFELLSEEDAMLRQLAGNAFCANICLVFLVAVLLSS